ncbi:MAG: NAD(P)-dependent glycerol-3-phosphate dehydrogenase [Rhizobiaceae bacterium]|nr:NAD(P)-dependent glycerol-3-phosphate dehydrogenase [Rhizobiaceae bacterium]MCV0407632.1 NAD(P)-dependent glycerol-3-phosphate dehydrogenase [Rhizobiaceae bacterium]
MTASSGKATVLGGGAWGTALAQMLARGGLDVAIWARDAATVEAINRQRVNPRYLPDVPLDDRIVATTDMAKAMTGAQTVLAVTPAQTLRAVLPLGRPYLPPDVPLVLCAKGIEKGTGLFPSAVARETLGAVPLAALSGPSFAADVARGLPTAVTVASEDGDLAAKLAARLSGPGFRCYSSDDLAGVEAGGALKNVLAIAVGAASGAGLGASAQAALATRGFVELRRFATTLGARPGTLMGLSGLGDLMLTCASAQSRNFAYGVELGRGAPLEGLKLAEGVATAGIAARLARQHGIDAPIIAATAMLLEHRLTIGEAVETLLSRPLKTEDN